MPSHLEAQSEVQGGRWLESSAVRSEPKEGYGLRHRHSKQTEQPDVKAAVIMAHSGRVEADRELHNKARAAEQGGRWLSEDENPRTAASQADQPDVKEALQAAHEPIAQVSGVAQPTGLGSGAHEGGTGAGVYALSLAWMLMCALHMLHIAGDGREAGEGAPPCLWWALVMAMQCPGAPSSTARLSISRRLWGAHVS